SSALAVGSHSITAVYKGDAADGPSTSPAVGQVVNQASTTTALTSSLNPSKAGDSVTFTATPTVDPPAAGPPTGPVTFRLAGAPPSPPSLSGAAVRAPARALCRRVPRS